ncbi:MAG TPA: MaoC family dehydratase, partial [Ilumatobacter sp.]|nr:MaoC family dehydratase [Ilumatobacter sp.]
MITPSRTWTVDEASHAAFVQLSGDLNPIHTDELAARRLPFGEVVVHGVHVLLRALDHWAAANPDLAPTHLSATFRQPVGIGRWLTAAWSEPTDDSHLDRGANNQVDIAVDAHGVRAVDIRIAVVTASTDTAADQVTESLPALTTRMLYPTGWAIEELDGRSGAVPVDADTAALVAMFPALVAVTGMAAARELVALTALVGMHVPGLHSMFSSLSVEFG